MTIQTDATTRTTAPLTPAQAQAQRQNEDADARAASGIDLPPIPGASDNLSEGHTTEHITPPKSVADIVRERQASQAQDQEDFLASIAARRRAHMQDGSESEDDNAAFNEELDNADETLENQSQEQDVAVAQEAQQETEVPPVQDNQPHFFTGNDGKQYCELLVNGEKKVVLADRVLSQMQKLEAGDERLRQAAAERQQLEADRQRFLQEQQAARQTTQPSVPDAATLKAQLRQGFDRLVNEGDDSAIDGLVETLLAGSQNAPDPQQIVNQTLTIQNQRAWDADLVRDAEAFDADPAFADVTGNEVLVERAKQIAIQLTTSRDARNLNIRPLGIMQEAAIMAREEALRYAGALGYAPTQPQTQQGNRAEATAARKQQLGNTVTGGAAPVPQGTDARKPANPDGGRNPSAIDAKAAAFAGMQAVRTQPAIKR